jgi:glycosyltransferase involved in cell wall biosynthesis
MNERGSVVLLSSVHWHFTWQRHHEIAARLAAGGWNVVFVEPLPKRWPSRREMARVWGRLAGRRELAGLCRQREVAGVRIVSPRLVPDTSALARSLNRRLVPGLARRLLDTCPARPRIVVNYLPIAAANALQRALRPDLAVYDCVWDWPNDPYSRPGTVREEELVAGVDLVLADAPFLVERMRSLHPQVRELPPAVDYQRFAPARREPHVPGGAGARCAYFGAVGANIDVALLARLAAAFPLRVIGPIQVPLPPLGSRAELVGPVPREQVPELLADADVLVLPYREGGHSRGVLPAKTFECLATGKPTVAKGLPSLGPLEGLFALAADDEAFLAAVAEAPKEPAERRERRLAAARANDWALRIAELEGFIAEALARRGKR